MNVGMNARATDKVLCLNAFRNFVAEFVDGDRHPSQFADNDYRLAAAALLVHAAAIDGDMSQSERDKLHAVVKRRFDLDDGVDGRVDRQGDRRPSRKPSTFITSPACSIARSMRKAAPASSK